MMDLKPKPLPERVREYAQKCQDRADEAIRMGMIYAPGWHQTEADNLLEAADHIDALTEEVEALKRELQFALTFIENLANDDLDELIADGGVTLGMGFQQQARTVYAPRIRAALKGKDQ